MMRLIIMGKAITKLEQELKEIKQTLEELTATQKTALEDKPKAKGLNRGGAKVIKEESH